MADDARGAEQEVAGEDSLVTRRPEEPRLYLGEHEDDHSGGGGRPRHGHPVDREDHFPLVTRLLCALCVLFVSAGLSASQATPAKALTPELRTHVRDGRFGVVTSIRGLPLGVREALQELFGTLTLDIAEPGAEFQRTDVLVKPNLPTRRMVAAGCSTDHYCLVYYERGGFTHSWHVVLYRWRPTETRFEWGGSAPANLRSIDEVRKAILSGAVKAGQGTF